VLLDTLVRKVELLLKGLGRGGLVKIVDGGIDKWRISRFETAMYDSFLEDLFNELGVKGSWNDHHGDAQSVVYVIDV
jgi:hypothetical protein